MLEETVQTSRGTWRQLDGQWQGAKSEWHDRNAHRFEQNFWMLISEETEEYQQALAQLSDTLRRTKEFALAMRDSIR